jgi:hypothetical protein
MSHVSLSQLKEKRLERWSCRSCRLAFDRLKQFNLARAAAAADLGHLQA